MSSKVQKCINKEEEIKVSIIVPVYNVEKYLDECLTSLVNQTLEEIEIIIVNDGSLDNSKEIIEKYKDKYPNKIKAFTKPNGGLGSARNYGLERARGKYIGFVDSDDWVDIKMFETLYNTAIKGYDIVVCDVTSIKDGWEKGWLTTGFKGQNRSKEEFVLHSTNPAFAWNKLYDRKFFKMIQFNEGLYEDIATTPIILSFANNIAYVELALYYYRQRAGSITTNVNKRVLEVIDGWRRVLTHVNKQYSKEAEFAIAYSINEFIKFKPEFADEFIEFANQELQCLKNNAYYIDAVKNNIIKDLVKLKLIPKKIHYFWFGKGKKSKLIDDCIKSWEKYAPDYEIIEWNEENCNLEENEFVKQAYNEKRWAFVADYFRLKVIYEEGGIYLDTDTELFNRLDKLRLNSAFFAFETPDVVHAGIFGALPKHKLLKKWLKSYDKIKLNKENKLDTSDTIVKKLSNILEHNYEIVFNNKTQLLKDDIMIYSPNILTVDTFDGQNIAVHHYDASWWDVKDEISYKNKVLEQYFLNKSDNIYDNFYVNDLIKGNEFYRNLVHTYENTISWKLTKPLRKLTQLKRKLIKSRRK